MKEIMVSVLPAREQAFHWAKELLDFDVKGKHEQVVDENGLPASKDLGQRLIVYRVALSNFQYAVFHGTALTCDQAESQARFVRTVRDWQREDNHIDLDLKLEEGENRFREYGMAGWLLSQLVNALAPEGDLPERFAALRKLEAEGIDPQRIIESGAFQVVWE